MLSFVDPAATTVRADAEAAMPLVKVEKANVEGALSVELASADADPTAGSAGFRAILIAKSVRGGAPVGYCDHIEIDWVRRGDQWLIRGYTVYENGRPVDAVGRARRGAR